MSQKNLKDSDVIGIISL